MAQRSTHSSVAVQIVVNHLTRMTKGYICVGGVDVETGNHIRPVLGRRLTAELLTMKGGMFEIGARVDLGHVTDVGHPPETEDHAFDPAEAAIRDYLPPAEFWRLLLEKAENSLATIFGPALTQRRSSCTVELGQGAGSLGVLRPESASIEVNNFGKLRLLMSDRQFNVDLSLADLRLYDGNYEPDEGLVADISARIGRGVPTLVSVGLTRAWRKSNDTTERHWL